VEKGELRERCEAGVSQLLACHLCRQGEHLAHLTFSNVIKNILPEALL
jgi:hypothetical protein